MVDSTGTESPSEDYSGNPGETLGATSTPIDPLNLEVAKAYLRSIANLSNALGNHPEMEKRLYAIADISSTSPDSIAAQIAGLRDEYMVRLTGATAAEQRKRNKLMRDADMLGLPQETAALLSNEQLASELNSRRTENPLKLISDEIKQLVDATNGVPPRDPEDPDPIGTELVQFELALDYQEWERGLRDKVARSKGNRLPQRDSLSMLTQKESRALWVAQKIGERTGNYTKLAEFHQRNGNVVARQEAEVARDAIIGTVIAEAIVPLVESSVYNMTDRVINDTPNAEEIIATRFGQKPGAMTHLDHLHFRVDTYNGPKSTQTTVEVGQLELPAEEHFEEALTLTATYNTDPTKITEGQQFLVDTLAKARKIRGDLELDGMKLEESGSTQLHDLSGPIEMLIRRGIRDSIILSKDYYKGTTTKILPEKSGIVAVAELADQQLGKVGKRKMRLAKVKVASMAFAETAKIIDSSKNIADINSDTRVKTLMRDADSYLVHILHQPDFRGESRGGARAMTFADTVRKSSTEIVAIKQIQLKHVEEKLEAAYESGNIKEVRKLRERQRRYRYLLKGAETVKNLREVTGIEAMKMSIEAQEALPDVASEGDLDRLTEGSGVFKFLVRNRLLWKILPSIMAKKLLALVDAGKSAWGNIGFGGYWFTGGISGGAHERTWMRNLTNLTVTDARYNPTRINRDGDEEMDMINFAEGYKAGAIQVAWENIKQFGADLGWLPEGTSRKDVELSTGYYVQWLQKGTDIWDNVLKKFAGSMGFHADPATNGLKILEGIQKAISGTVFNLNHGRAWEAYTEATDLAMKDAMASEEIALEHNNATYWGLVRGEAAALVKAHNTAFTGNIRMIGEDGRATNQAQVEIPTLKKDSTLAEHVGAEFTVFSAGSRFTPKGVGKYKGETDAEFTTRLEKANLDAARRKAQLLVSLFDYEQISALFRIVPAEIKRMYPVDYAKAEARGESELELYIQQVQHQFYLDLVTFSGYDYYRHINPIGEGKATLMNWLSDGRAILMTAEQESIYTNDKMLADKTGVSEIRLNDANRGRTEGWDASKTKIFKEMIDKNIGAIERPELVYSLIIDVATLTSQFFEQSDQVDSLDASLKINHIIRRLKIGAANGRLAPEGGHIQEVPRLIDVELGLGSFFQREVDKNGKPGSMLPAHLPILPIAASGKDPLYRLIPQLYTMLAARFHPTALRMFGITRDVFYPTLDAMSGLDVVDLPDEMYTREFLLPDGKTATLKYNPLQVFLKSFTKGIERDRHPVLSKQIINRIAGREILNPYTDGIWGNIVNAFTKDRPTWKRIYWDYLQFIHGMGKEIGSRFEKVGDGLVASLTGGTGGTFFREFIGKPFKGALPTTISIIPSAIYLINNVTRATFLSDIIPAAGIFAGMMWGLFATTGMFPAGKSFNRELQLTWWQELFGARRGVRPTVFNAATGAPNVGIPGIESLKAERGKYKA